MGLVWMVLSLVVCSVKFAVASFLAMTWWWVDAIFIFVSVDGFGLLVFGRGRPNGR